MSNKIQKVKLPIIKTPIVKKPSSFIGGSAYSSAKVIPNKDAYKRM